MDLGADRRGVDMGPSALRYADLNEHLTELGYEVEDLGDLDVIIPETQHYGDPQAKYLKEIADACTHLANLTLDVYERGTHAAGPGRRSFDRRGNRFRDGGSISPAKEEARPDLVRRACRHEYAGNLAKRQRPWHADGVDPRLWAAGTREHLRFLAQASTANASS